MSPFDALSVCAEVAIAILGFSGIVVVFSERSQESAAQPMFRTLFRGTLIPLAIIALAFILEAASLEAPTIWRICSTVHAIALSFILFNGVRATRRQPGSALWAPTVGAFLVLGLSALNALTLVEFWPVLTVICWALGISLYAFAGLIFSSSAA